MASDIHSDVGTFAGRVLRRALWPHQIEAAKAEGFITTIAAARRTGKTVLAETLAIHTAFANRGCRVLILSATQDAARRLTESIGTTLNRRRLTRGAVVDSYSTRVSLANGSQIVSLPASQRQVRGYGEGVLLVILDEAGFMPSEMWTAAHYTAMDERANGSRILMLGTPWGVADHFFRRAFEAGRDGDPDHASFHWTFEANPKLDRAYLERQRERVSPAEYAAEVLGEWSDAAGSLFPRELLERNTADVELPEWSELAGPARLAAGIDWGVSFDRSAAVALGRLPVWRFNEGHKFRPVFGVVGVKVWPAGELLSKVVDGVVETGAKWAIVSPETNGVGAGPTQELRRRLLEREERALQWHRLNTPDEPWAGHGGVWLNCVAATAPRKTDAYGRLLFLLEQGRLVLPRHPDLLRQLAGLRFEQGERGLLGSKRTALARMTTLVTR